MNPPGDSRVGPASAVRVDLQVAKGADGVPRAAQLRSWVAAAAAGRVPAAEVSIRVVGATEGRRLNRDFRGKDAPTNVLSFPAAGPVIEPDIGPDDESNAEGKTRPLGDIVLARETVMREAVEQAVDFSHHVTHLIVHGVLHLLGYDHGVDAEAEEMEALEIEILSELGIDNPYTEEPVGSV